jgi:very-short-patch-repair endonuclease
MDSRKMFYSAPPEIFAKAKILRDNMTDEEKILWSELRANKLNGIRFKPQHPINYFIADFYCHKAKLVVEIDGKSHDETEQIQYDRDRTLAIESFGIKVIRFKNSEVKNNLNHVLSTINATASGLIEKNQSSAPALKGEIDLKTVPNSSLQGVEGKKGGIT